MSAKPANVHPIRPARMWTSAKQAEFLRQLSATHSVAGAARAVGMSRQSAYRLRARLKGEPFDAAWDAAFQRVYDALAQAALERALNGVEVPHFYKGELVGTSRKYDERLTVALLAMRECLSLPQPVRHAEAAHYAPHDFEALVERVESGEELWAEADDADA